MLRFKFLLFIISFLTICAPFGSFAQRGKHGAKTISTANQVVNEYTTLTTDANIGDITINVSSSLLNTNSHFSTNLEVGDLVMIIQIQGASTSCVASPWPPIHGEPNDINWGKISSYHNCGNYEFAQVSAIPDGTSITFECGLKNSYSTAGKTEIIRVPRYVSLTINNGGSLTCDTWNGSVGGIVVVEVDSNTTINSGGSINATGKGFRGAALLENLAAIGGGFWAAQDAQEGAEKGEGILGYQTDYTPLGGRYCKASPANGGGGGNANNGGGGGGANAGDTTIWTGNGIPNITTVIWTNAWNLEYAGFATSTTSGGGRGGYTFSGSNKDALTVAPGVTGAGGWGGDNRRNMGGLGGKPLDYSTGKIFLGGGGGSGDQGDGFGGPGANGGGMIYLLNYGTFSGLGSIVSNGNNGTNATSGNGITSTGTDGAGGGGAGGTIILNSVGTISGISCTANGGNGGNQVITYTTPQAQGPGGGGGGGYIAITNGSITKTTNGGNNGTTNSTSLTEFPPNGATKGCSGIDNGTVLNPIFDLVVKDDTICAGTSTILTITVNPSLPTGITVEWYDASTGGNLLGSGLSYVTPVLNATTDYYVTTCPGSFRKRIQVFVVNAPIAFAGNDTTICFGSSAQLHGSGGSTYLWSPVASLSNVAISNPLATPAISETYILTASIGSCAATDDIIVSVTPAIIAFAGNDTTICSGISASLHASGGTTFYWSPAATLNNAAIYNPTASPLANTTYTVTVSVGSCSNTDNIIVSVTPAISANAGNDTTICIGTSANLHASGGTNYLWNPAATLNNSTISNPVATPIATTTYQLSVTNACMTATDTVIVYITNLPVVSVSNDTSICGASLVQLTATGGTSYIWSPATALSNTTISNPVANPTVTTTYTVIVTGSCGTASDAVIILADTPVNPSAGLDLTTCVGGSITLNGSGGNSYLWSPSATLDNPTIPNPIASPLVNTTYTLTVTNGLCSGTDQMAVTIGSALTANAGNDTVLCPSATLQLNASGGTNFTWSPAATLSSSSIGNPIATPIADVTYSLTVTDGTGCSGTDEIIITLAAPPSATASNDTLICGGNSVQLMSSGGTSFSWSPTVALSNALIANPIASPTVSTTYTVTVTSGCGTASDAVIITADTPVNPSAGNDVTICVGSTTTLNGSGGISYLWNPAASLDNPTISNPIASPVVNTTYTVTVSNGLCSGTDQMVVTIGSSLPAFAGNDTTICSGTSITLNASGGTNYNWAASTTLSSTTISNPIATPTANTTYSLTITDATGCSGTDEIIIIMAPATIATASNDTAICGGSPVQLVASGGTSYSWSPTIDLTNATISNPMASPTVSTTYVVTVTGACGSASANVVITADTPVLPSAGIDATICTGGSTSLNGSGGSAYLWSPAASLDNFTIANPVANPTISTTYVLTVTNGLCSGTDQVIVTIGTSLMANAGNDTTICPGNSLQLAASGGSNFIWSPSATLSDSTISNPVASPGTNTTYSLTVTDGTGCSGTDEIIVSIGTTPIASAGNDVSICNGENIVLHASGGSTYDWNPSTDLNNGFVSNPTASPTITTTYTVTVINAAGCTASDDIIVSVISATIADAGSDVTICSGGSILLNASGGTNFVWSPATGLDNPNIQSPTASPVNTTTYTVTASIGSCSSTDDIIITVGTNLVANAGNDTVICGGSPVQLQASGGLNFNWSPGNTLSDSTISNPIAFPAGNITYYLTVSDGICSGIDSVHITAFPAAIANAGFDDSICSGSSTQLQGSGGVTYTWSPSTSLNSYQVPNPIATPGANTTYTLTIVDNNGCMATDSVVINVLPILNANAGTDVSICAGGSANLIATGGTIFSWLPVTGLSNPSIPNPIASPLSTTTYVVAVSDGFCNDIDTVIVSVIPALNASAGADVNICSGSSMQFHATGGTVYQWAPSTNLTNFNTANPTANPTVTTTYTVTVANATGCFDIDTLVANVIPVPIANVGNDTVTCLGTAIQLNASGGTSYQWSPAAGLSNSSIPNPFATPTVSTTYTLVVTSANNCTASDQLIVSVLSNTSANAGADVFLCFGGSVNLSATGGNTYAWSPSSGLSNTATSNPIATPTATTIYTVTATSSCGSSTDQIMIVVKPQPNSSIIAGGPTLFCEGGFVSLNANTAPGLTYQWLLNGTTLPSGTGASYSAQLAGNYQLVVTNSCESDISTITTVTTKSRPTLTISPEYVVIDAGSQTTLSIQVTGGDPPYVYSWSPTNHLTGTNAETAVVSPLQTTSYTATVKDNIGCASTKTSVVEVTIKENVFLPNVFSPNGDNENDILFVHGMGIKTVYIAIYDRWGVKVFETEDITVGWDGNYKGKNLDPAVFGYVLKVEFNSGKQITKCGNITLVK